MADAARLLPLWPATGFGVVATAVASVLCLRGLVERIGADHRIVRAAGRAPGMRCATMKKRRVWLNWKRFLRLTLRISAID